MLAAPCFGKGTARGQLWKQLLISFFSCSIDAGRCPDFTKVLGNGKLQTKLRSALEQILGKNLICSRGRGEAHLKFIQVCVFSDIMCETMVCFHKGEGYTAFFLMILFFLGDFFLFFFCDFCAVENTTLRLKKPHLPPLQRHS